MITKKSFAKMLITLGLLAGPLFGTVKPLFATATKPVNYCFMAKKLDGSDYTACQAYPTDSQAISLDMGDKVRFAMRVGIDREMIDDLQYRAYFPLKNPTYIMTSVKPDAKPAQALDVNLDLPDNSFLSYIPGTTLYVVMDEDNVGHADYPVADAGGRSALYANSGSSYTVNDAGRDGEPFWSFMYFDMEVVSGDNAPEAPAPQMDLEATVANLTAGESLTQKLTSTNIVSGDTVRIKYWLHNGQMYSLAEDVKLKVAGFAEGVVIGSNFDPVTGVVTLVTEDGITLTYVAGSARFHRYADAAGTALTDSEVSALFGSGLEMGNAGTMNGCWIYQQWVEFDLKAGSVLPAVTPDTPKIPPKDVPKVLAATGPEHVVATALYLGYLGFLLRKLKLTRYI